MDERCGAVRTRSVNWIVDWRAYSMTPSAVNQRAQAPVALAANTSGQKLDLTAVKIIARRQHLNLLGLD